MSKLAGLVVALLVFSSNAEAKMPKDVLDCPPETSVACDGFWDRQSKKAKDFILSFKGKDRNAALTCYALFGYKVTKGLRSCALTLIGDRRSLAHCEKKGHELMSEPMEKCRNKFRRKKGYPLPY